MIKNKQDIEISNSVEELNQDINKHVVGLNSATSSTGCLTIKSANQWIEEAKNRPIPNMLFDRLWYEQELCIMYADTNLGKSILAVQIGNSISRGKRIEGFEIEASPKKVAYLDFELSDKQFENRYSNNYSNHFVFHDNFLRAEINSEVDIPKEYKNLEDYLVHYIETIIVEHGVEVLIIDNITYLKSDNERAKDALSLMKHLKAINKKHGVSILVLAHTPKRDASKPITNNDLSGSKMLINFCDSAFAIGQSATEPHQRYLKQIKQRNTEQVYHSDNVPVFMIENPNNFLRFSFLEFSREQEHLKQSNYNDLEERDSEMTIMINDGLSNVAIGEKLGVSEGAVRKRRKRIKV